MKLGCPSDPELAEGEEPHISFETPQIIAALLKVALA
jgi:hypothetical protein